MDLSLFPLVLFACLVELIWEKFGASLGGDSSVCMVPEELFHLLNIKMSRLGIGKPLPKIKNLMRLTAIHTPLHTSLQRGQFHNLKMHAIVFFILLTIKLTRQITIYSL